MHLTAQVQAPQYVARGWVSNDSRFYLGNAQGDNCAACDNRCPCDSANQKNGAYNAPLSHALLRYQPEGTLVPAEVPVSSSAVIFSISKCNSWDGPHGYHGPHGIVAAGL